LIINLYRDRPNTFPGTRVIETQLGIEGVRFADPLNAQRIWQIETAYMPVPGRILGGLRVKVRDQRDFISFCNQRDLEVILGYAQPGELCPWLDEDYVDCANESWVGLACDDEDLRDDLLEREGLLRTQMPMGILTTEYDIARRVHIGKNYDVEDLFVMLGDYAPETGQSPDTRFETIEHRWMRAERKRVRWEKS
jgi:hypothetical protein